MLGNKGVNSALDQDVLPPRWRPKGALSNALIDCDADGRAAFENEILPLTGNCHVTKGTHSLHSTGGCHVARGIQ